MASRPRNGAGAQMQVGRLWMQGRDQVWSGCLYGIYGTRLGKTISFRANMDDNIVATRPRPVSFPPGLPMHNSMANLSVEWSDVYSNLSSFVNSTSETPAMSNCPSPLQLLSSASNAETVSPTDTAKLARSIQQDMNKYGLDLAECDAVYPASFEGRFVDFGSKEAERLGFTILEKSGHVHHFCVSSSREQRKWIERIAAVISGIDGPDLSQYDSSTLIKLLEDERERMLELSSKVLQLDLQYKEACEDRDSIRMALFAALDRLSSLKPDASMRKIDFVSQIWESAGEEAIIQHFNEALHSIDVLDATLGDAHKKYVCV